MDIILYIAILISGTVFGSFYTLAVHRIPKKEDITHVRSYCPNCNHKLGNLDLIPVLSYIFLGGKCRYCKTKIRPRYLILEILSGLVFFTIALTRKISIQSSLNEFIMLALTYLFTCGLFIIGGIDREKIKTPNGLNIYIMIIAIAKIIYSIVAKISIIDNIIGLAIPLLIGLANVLLDKKENKILLEKEDIKYIMAIGLFLGYKIMLAGIVLAGIIGIAEEIIKAIKSKQKNIENTKLQLGYYLSLSTTLLIIICK